MKRYNGFLIAIAGAFTLILLTAYFMDRNKIENTITIVNQTDVAAPKMTFYLTQSNSADDAIIKGEKFGEASSVPSNETSVVVSDTEVEEDSNIVFEYRDASGELVIDYVNDYIPFDSKKYAMEVELVAVNNEGVFEYK